MARSIVVVGINGVVTGLDRRTGTIVWRNDLEGGGREEVYLAVTERRVMASAHGDRLFCLDYATGATLWSAETEASGRASIVLDDTEVVVAKDGYIDCFSIDGQHLWRQQLKGLGVGRAALGVPGNVAQADDPGIH